MSTCVRLGPHTSTPACAHTRLHTSAHFLTLLRAFVRLDPHRSAQVSTGPHAPDVSACVCTGSGSAHVPKRPHKFSHVRMCSHRSAHVRTRSHRSAHVRTGPAVIACVRTGPHTCRLP